MYLKLAPAAIGILGTASLALGQYSLRLLTDPGDASVNVINNSGNVVGRAYGSTADQLTRWVGAAPQTVPTAPFAVEFFFPQKHLHDGTILGSMRVNGNDVGFLHQGGVTTEVLTTVASGIPSTATAINAAGVFAGQIDNHAVIWTQASGSTVIRFPEALPANDYGGAVAINDAGVVAGFSMDNLGLKAFRWTAAGGISRIVNLGGSNNFATDMNQAGAIVGTAATGDEPEDPEKAFLWVNGNVTVLTDLLEPDSSGAVAINELGVVLGYDGNPVSIGMPILDPWVWENGQKKLLRTMVTLPAGYRIETAHDLNDNGEILVTLLDESTFSRLLAVLVPSAGGCYANCDASTAAPVLNVADFTCFLTRFASGDPYANCDQSTAPPTLNVADFTCFLTKFAGGCP